MKSRELRKIFSVVVCMMCTSLYYGCSSSPTREEMTSLEEIRVEIKSMELHKSMLQQKQTALNTSIAAKEAQLKNIDEKKSELMKYQ